MSSDSQELLYEQLYESTSDLLHPVHTLAHALACQIRSGMIHIDGYESERSFQGRLDGYGGHTRLRNEDGTPVSQYRKYELERELRRGPKKGRSISVEDMLQVSAKVYANQHRCSHEAQSETGESVPMGSFTARPTSCESCGRRFSGD